MVSLYRYRSYLRKKKYPFACALCKALILPKHYEKHCSSHHDIPIKTTCAWCRRHSWHKGKKHEGAGHLLSCAKKVLNVPNHHTPPPPVDTPLRLLNFNHPHQQQHIYGFESLPAEHGSLWPLDPHTPRVTFPDPNTNLSLSYLETFLEWIETHEWYHAMVKPVSFQSLVDALEADRGKTQTLQFSCWCDGGPYPEARHRQHRHLILVAPIGHFKNKFWPKVKMSNRKDVPGRNFPSKRCKKIESPLHLVNAMGYLSGRKSRCNFSFNDSNKTASSLNHFYLYRTLPIDFRLPLVLFWEEGLSQWLHRIKFQHVSIPILAQTDLQLEDGTYRQKIKDCPKHERGWVLPVDKKYRPTKKVTPHYLHLMNGQKLYFEICSESMDDDTWLRKQAEGGNRFYDNVGNELWTPRPCVQAVLNYHKPTVDENKKLKAENVTLKTENDTTKRKYEESLEESKKVKMENEKVKMENEKVKMENAELKRKATARRDTKNVFVQCNITNMYN